MASICLRQSAGIKGGKGYQMNLKAILPCAGNRLHSGGIMKRAVVVIIVFIITCFFVDIDDAQSAASTTTMGNYCVQPASVTQTVPPLVMFVMSRDHKLFYKAYNDLVDLNDDGTIDSTYNDAIDYYGYFGPNLCYDYSSNMFVPSAVATGTNQHYCTSKWSGNFLNWATMSRMDILRKVMYGGKRTTDTSSTTVLSRVFLPRDAHSWAKAYNGSDISSLTPTSWSGITLCNTNTTKTENSSLVFAIRGFYPYAASTEGKQCTITEQGGSNLVEKSSIAFATTNGNYVKYNADVKVCDNTVGLESNCEVYGTSYKPQGLIQRFGFDRHGTDDTSDDTMTMYFGLMTGSYSNNVSGGVLRRNIKDVPSTEVDNSNGQIKGSSSKIITNIDNMKIIQYNYSTGWYDEGGTEGTCSPSEPAVLTNGTCKSWGNPMGEMFYEAIRYFEGKASATSEYRPSNPDAGLSSLTVESQWCDPYVGGGSCTAFPTCSKPFILMMSDVYPSYDSDQLPGSYWPSAISTSDVPSVQTLVNNSGINTIETLGNVFIGESAGNFDRSCTAKSTTNFGTLRGLCVEEPTKQGSYYIAGLAHYARTTDLHTGAGGDQKVTTYVVATESIPSIEVTAGSSKVKLLPTFHDGCPNTSLPGCSWQGQNGDNSKGTLVSMMLCPNDADWTAEQANGYTRCYDILWDDAEYGWDYDLDISMRLYIKNTSSTIDVKSKGRYAAAGHTDYAGYIINGIGSPGTYWDIRCGGVAGFNGCQKYDGTGSIGAGTAVVTRSFNITGSDAGLLKDPLWYAAKYGGFDDLNGNNQPDLQNEWDKDNDGVPDTYFYAANPLKLEEQLAKALTDILRRASSGTAASVLSSSEGSGANIVQAVFYPRRLFGTGDTYWTGEIQNLWYHIDPFLQNSTIREDTTENKVLNLIEDYIIQFYFDTGTNETRTRRWSDTDGDGVGDSLVDTVQLEDVKTLWKAGQILWARNVGTYPRTIYTTTTGSSFLSGDFSTSNASTLSTYLQAADVTEAQKIINFIHGTDQTGYRSRTVTIGGASNTWKLGDIVSSTPRVQSSVPVNSYHLTPPDGYSDTTYRQYINTTDYLNRGMVYAGANDGMLHAFKLGKLEQTWTGQGTNDKARLSGTDLGNEMWSFIPKNSLPYLKYLMDRNYCHLFYIDNPSYLIDASVFGGSGTVQNPTQTKTVNSWKTLLVGGMGTGGACRNKTASCTDCVKTPLDGVGYSSYFALDVTDPISPSLLWEFSDATLGFSTSGSAVVRVGSPETNGKWFVLFASGPTGPIDTQWQQFMGKSDQNLRIFVVDLYSGQLLKTFDTGIAYAFGGSLYNATFDAERGDLGATGRYSDDVIYVGYTEKDVTAGTWTKGGVLRINTHQDTNPDNWSISKVIENIGPVTSAVTKLQNRKNRELWLYFGTGRFFYKTNYGTVIDDADGQRALYGIKEPCYNTSNLFDASCGTTITTANLINQTTSPQLSLATGSQGWYINLDTTTTTNKAERVITDPLAAFNGVVFFTTFAPSTDPCAIGGNTYIWALSYSTGYNVAGFLSGKGIIQVSTGEVKELSLGSVFTQKDQRRTAGMTGVPPRGQGLSVLIGPRPLRKILHMQEK